ncbi:TetR/AcrR family transcriptional regulator [Gordonia sp. CPCC 205515]|uniref:TetR/AcrR family transcriptional regulator n=1 Tax=Gordonia sp. CPCC 205515 TaxID=3140791 RepID=UPI003AF36171
MTSPDRPGYPQIPRHLALLWDRPDPAPRRGPRPTLTIHEIGHAAVAIADGDGFDAVSMKAVASRLGVTTMSLYRYVDSKDDLLEVMVDDAYGPVTPLPETGPWRDRVTGWALAVTAVLRRRAWLATMPMSRPPVGPNVLSWTNAGVFAFSDTALTGQQKMSALLLVDGFVRHHVRQASQMGLLDADDHVGLTYERLVAEFVDEARFPHLAEAITALGDDPDDDFFDTELAFGLDVILDGVHDLIESRRIEPKT